MNETITRANERLTAAFRDIGYTLEELSGVIDSVSVRDRIGRYLFAWHRQENHLLFYLRKEALDIQSTLRQKAVGRHPPEQVNRNRGGETTITLNSDEEAQTLLGWLLPRLPLPH